MALPGQAKRLRASFQGYRDTQALIASNQGVRAADSWRVVIAEHNGEVYLYLSDDAHTSGSVMMLSKANVKQIAKAAAAAFEVSAIAKSVLHKIQPPTANIEVEL